MWDDARSIVAETFFGDTILLYEDTPKEDDLGEEIADWKLVDEFACNIENSQSSFSQVVSGTSTPQQIRISLTKFLPVSYDKRYRLTIKSARIAFDANEYWKVDGWTEGQISTVITASREVSV